MQNVNDSVTQGQGETIDVPPEVDALIAKGEALGASDVEIYEATQVGRGFVQPLADALAGKCLAKPGRFMPSRMAVVAAYWLLITAERTHRNLLAAGGRTR